MLLDSNIVIYLQHPDYSQLIADRIGSSRLSTCNVVVAEVLGFDQLEPDERSGFEALLGSMKNLPFDEAVTKKVIELRRQRRIQLPDAIISATAIVNGIALWTHNVEDFVGIADLTVVDPLIAE